MWSTYVLEYVAFDAPLAGLLLSRETALLLAFLHQGTFKKGEIIPMYKEGRYVFDRTTCPETVSLVPLVSCPIVSK